MSKQNGKSGLSRRGFLASAAAATTAVSALSAPAVMAEGRPRVVVVGGGAGGATAARYIAKDSKGAVDVTLVEPSRAYYSCFFSNLYIGGFREYASIGHSYGALAANHGINVVHDWAVSIDREKRSVGLAGGGSLAYDRLVLSPGIDFRDGSVPGWGPLAAEPHAARLQGGLADPASQGADRSHAGRRHLLHGGAPQPVPLPARALRAHLDGGPRAEAVQPDGEDHHRRPQGEVLQAGAVRGRLAAPLPPAWSSVSARISAATRSRSGPRPWRWWWTARR